MRLLRVMLMLVVGLMAGRALALPSIMNYQGTLKRGDGTLPAVGTHTIQFRLFDQANGGNELYKQTRVAYVDTNGMFSVTLGQFDDSARALSAVFSGVGVGTRYLELTITANPSGAIGSPSPILPRQEMANAPFALRAGYAEDVGSTLGNLQVGGDLRITSNIVSTVGQFSILGGGGSRLEMTNVGDIILTPYRGVSVTNASFFRATLSGGQDAFRLETNVASIVIDGVETRFTSSGATNRIAGQSSLLLQGSPQPTGVGQSEVLVRDGSVAMNAKDPAGLVKASMSSTVGGTNILSSTALQMAATTVEVTSGGAVGVAGASMSLNSTAAMNLTAGTVAVTAGSVGIAASNVTFTSTRNIKVNNYLPMFVRHESVSVGMVGDKKDTGVSTNDYTACVVGLGAVLDINEYGQGNWFLRMIPLNGTWQILWNYHLDSLGGGDKWVDVLFIRRELCSEDTHY